MTDLLDRLETYYDAAPRPTASTEQVGPFTLFLKSDSRGWPYYARPRLGLDEPLTAYDVEAVRDRQRTLGVPESIEWVHETTPSLLDAVRSDAVDAVPLTVHECPLLVYAGAAAGRPADEALVEVLAADSPRLGATAGAIDAGFQGSDEYAAKEVSRHMDLIRRGLSVVVGAFDDHGAVGGGTHSPRGAVTELTGIAVLPRARRRGIGTAITHALVADALASGVETIFLSAQDDAVARVYERVGFRRVGTACVAEPAAPRGTEGSRP